MLLTKYYRFSPIIVDMLCISFIYHVPTSPNFMSRASLKYALANSLTRIDMALECKGEECGIKYVHLICSL